MENSISRQNVNVNVRAVLTDPNVTVQYKTKVLQKNVVEGVNTLTPAMISEANMKYVIKYDFVLAEDITIPENCILEFDGGCISGAHTISGQNTGIEAGLVKIFSTDVAFAGSWNVVEAYPEWFGADGNPSTPNQNIMITKASILGKSVLLTQNYYFPYDNYSYGICSIDLRCPKLKGTQKSHIFVDAKRENTEYSTIIEFQHLTDVELDGVYIEYLNYDYSGWTGIQAGIIRSADTQGKLTIKNCTIKRGMGAAIHIFRTDASSEGTKEILIDNNIIVDCDCSIITQGLPLNLNNVTITHNRFYKPELGRSEFISFFCDSSIYNNVYIEENSFERGRTISGAETGSTIYALKGTINNLILRSNIYKYCSEILIYNTSMVSISEELYEKSTMFDDRYAQQSGYSFINCPDVKISNSLIPRLNANNSIIEVNNTEFSRLLESDFVNNSTNSQNEFFNYPFIVLQNSKVVCNNIIFSLSKDKKMYTYCGNRIVSNNGNSSLFINNMTTYIPWIRFEDMLNFKIKGIRIGAYYGNFLIPAVSDDIYQLNNGDFHLSGGTLTKVASHVGKSKVLITTSGQPSQNGTAYMNLNGTIIPMYITSDTTGYATPAKIGHQLMGFLQDNVYITGYDERNIEFCTQYAPTSSNTTIDAGDTGITFTLSIS